MKYKRINDINTLQASNENELYISGKDEQGKDITIVFDSFNFLQWIDKQTIKYIKKQTIKYINKH